MNNPQESVDHSKSNDYRTIEQTMEKLSGGTRRLAAQLTTSASFDSLWNVLTDYDRLNLYIPNLLSSKKIYQKNNNVHLKHCLLYTSPSPRDPVSSRMPSSA